MAIRINVTDAYPHETAAARTQLAAMRPRRTYLGMTLPAATAIATAAAVTGAALGLALPSRVPTVFDYCAETNGAPLTADACASYLAERAALAAACGAIAAQDEYETCEAETLAAFLSVQR